MVALEFILLALALAAAGSVRPWRLLRAHDGAPALATPLLALLVLLPWFWSWPGLAGLPVPLHWSGAALAVLMLGWPLAVPVLAIAGASTLATVDASMQQALSTTVWAGLVPATAVLLLGHGVRRMFGTHPAAYLLGRAYAVPLLTLFAAGLVAAMAGKGFSAAPDATGAIVMALLMAMAEASWTFAVACILVACKPQWLATWSDALYLHDTVTAKAARTARARRAPVAPPAPSR